MNQSIACLRCKTTMEPGFIADSNQSGFLQERWYAGDPQSGFWGLKMKRDQLVPVTTYRCPNCGYLEAYAK